ncbi:MAG: hypothetical protein KJN77_01330 [Gammaproteobacteria bacterium]|nr:hypothetical protein [Gammaproteobacteria bacterium]
MLKLFITGIVLGILAAAGVLYAYPAVDQHREPSLLKVAPNGGTTELFHINLPDDRIMSRSPGQSASVPESLVWPADERFASAQFGVYKLRNESDVVVGLAARAAASEQSGALVEWVLHLPARGSQFVSMQTQPPASGVRSGVLRAGSREFDNRDGSVTVRWVAGVAGEQNAPDGRIELKTSYIGKRSGSE